jgi:hypothetical protein
MFTVTSHASASASVLRHWHTVMTRPECQCLGLITLA